MKDLTYPKVSIGTAAAELNRLYTEIEAGMRKTVADAIRAGEILIEVREHLPHGQFLPWIKENCTFSQPTASRWMRCFEHKNKLINVNSLQEAYRKVEQIETVEKQTEDQKARKRVEEFRKTGAKPKGWRRGTDDKLAKKEQNRQRQFDKAKERVKADRKKWAEQSSAESTEDALFDEAVTQLTEHTAKRQAFKERIRLSQAGESDAFIDALMDYLGELESDNRRIEACQNIIKVCRNIATELQR